MDELEKSRFASLLGARHRSWTCPIPAQFLRLSAGLRKPAGKSTMLIWRQKITEGAIPLAPEAA
jgi:hypothetical protein